MTDNLRDRIARALYEDWWHVSESWHEPPRWEKLSDAARDGWLRKGDAVIAELGMQVGASAMFLIDGKKVIHYRYTTEWIADE